MDNNTAQKLQAILSAKSDIKDAIEYKGVIVGDIPLNQYASKVYEIEGCEIDGLNGFLSVQSKTIQTSATQTANITYNRNCGIVDENNAKWDTLEWHQGWVENNYSPDGLSKPIGLWMNAFGLELIYLWPIIDHHGYSDVTGTILPEPTGTTFQHFIYNQNAITSATAADRTVWPANQSGMVEHGTAGKYKSDTWRSVINGDGLDMVCDNTMETFTIPSRDVGNSVAFMKDNYEEYMEIYYQQCEFCRALFAICSGIETTQPNGTKNDVEILNSSGQQASVGEDMYFWINGTNTGLKAKYNLNSHPSVSSNSNAALLTQAIADAIYNKQMRNGVNMNDTGVNSESKHVLADGMKGAEAIAVDGYWYIKTPYISNPNISTFNLNNNMADAPAVYVCKKIGVTLPTEKMLYPYWLNKTTHITSMVNLLRTIEHLSAEEPAVLSAACWSAVRSSARNPWCVAASNGNVYNLYNSFNRYSLLPCPLSSVAFSEA